MRPKCLPDNREASVRASERMCESERETRRSGECGGEERASVRKRKRREEAGSVEGRSERKRSARKRGVWGGGGSFSYGDELKSWRRASKGRALFLRGWKTRSIHGR